MVEYIDVQIGRVVRKLEKLSLMDNTLIMIILDNGAASVVPNSNDARGSKSFTTDFGIHFSPVINGEFELPRTSDHLIEITDL